jgi:hypothetical protein
MEKQKFILKIDAESPDGEIVKCHTEININCERHLSTTVVAKILKDNAELKQIFMDAFIILITPEENEILSQDISDEEYKKRINDDDIDL